MLARYVIEPATERILQSWIFPVSEKDISKKSIVLDLSLHNKHSEPIFQEDNSKFSQMDNTVLLSFCILEFFLQIQDLVTLPC